MSRVPSPPPSRWAGRLMTLALIVGAMACSSGARAAGKTLKETTDEIADLVAEVAKSQNQTSIRVTGFNNPFDSKKGAGAGIRGLLIAALKDRKIESLESATLGLMGTYTATKGTDGKSPDEFPVAKIDYKLATESGKVLLNSEAAINGESPGYVTDQGSVTEMAGANVEVIPIRKKEAAEKIVKALPSNPETATVVVDGTKVRPTKYSKFAVEILKAKLIDGKAPPEDQFTAVMPILRRGSPYVDLEKDDVYLVKVYNDNDYTAAAALSIDGVDMFHFSSEQKNRSRFWLFKKESPYALVGWHRTGEDFDSFLVGEYSKDGAGKEIVDESKLSQISVEFRAAWSDMKDMPADEGNLKEEEGSMAPPQTLRGPIQKKKNNLVSSHIGKFRARVTIRYDHDYPDLPDKPAN